MENLRRAIKQIAYTPQSRWLSTLPFMQLSLIPLLSLASSLYSVAVRLRSHLYRFCVLHTHRLPVPVISVGNLTWGGNGKTPMVELLARSYSEDGVSPLILTRGYGGGDEAKMLQRQLQGTSTKIGVGVNRVATAVRFLEQYGFASSLATFEKLFSTDKNEILSRNDKIGVAILDDGMQDLDMVKARLEALESKFGDKPVVVVTEKEYDRAPEVLQQLKQYEVLVVSSRLQFLQDKGSTEDRFRKIAREDRV